MKTILLLHDEATQPKQLLRNALPDKVPVRETEAVAGCNCDRWGIRVQAVSSALFNRHRRFRFQCQRRNEVKHGIPNCI